MTDMKIINEKILYEMSQVNIMRGDKVNACIWVHPSPDRNGTYFKMYNGLSIQKATKIARINFNIPSYESHVDEMGKGSWKLIGVEIKELISFMNSPYSRKSIYTNWDYCKWIWNRDLCSQLGIILDMDDYFDGVYDTDTRMPDNYVKYSQLMPDYSKLK